MPSICLRYTLQYIISSIVHFYTYSQTIGHPMHMESLHHTYLCTFRLNL